ncbi:MAG TPA: AtpZ/AtpI family protein [Devosia sp.]|jgi:ATP synthase protein I|nr:AtpZ/AtpI family protein [Devosia sp.]
MSEPRDGKRPESSSDGQRATADLEARIARAQARRPVDPGPSQVRQGNMSGLSLGWRLGSEFIAAILVGAGLGYLVDMFLPTRPWGLVVLLLLGFVAGVLNMVRATKEMNAASAVPPGTPAVRDDDDD